MRVFDFFDLYYIMAAIKKQSWYPWMFTSIYKLFWLKVPFLTSISLTWPYSSQAVKWAAPLYTYSTNQNCLLNKQKRVGTLYIVILCTYVGTCLFTFTSQEVLVVPFGYVYTFSWSILTRRNPSLAPRPSGRSVNSSTEHNRLNR